MILFGCTLAINAQSQGNVGINTATPSANLHIKSSGSTGATQALKVDRADGTNLLTINSDGTVSGAAAANLSGGGQTAAKTSGVFSGMTADNSGGFLSPIGNAFTTSPPNINAPEFFSVAQMLPFNAVLDQMTFSLRSDMFSPTQGPFTVELYINGQSTGMSSMIMEPILFPNTSYISFPVSGSIFLQRGDLFAFHISGLYVPGMNRYVSIRYTEQ